MPADITDPVWTLVNHVTISGHFPRVLNALTHSPAGLIKFGEPTNPDIKFTFRSITELRDREIVELLIPKGRKEGQIYGLARLGDQVAAEVGV